MTSTQISSTPVAVDPTFTAAAVSSRGVIKAEAIKVASVRSNIITLVASGLAMIIFGVVFAALAGNSGNNGPGDGSADSLSVAFAGVNFAQIVIGVFGVLLITNEYANGLIRTMFAIIPKRIPVLVGKVVVTAGFTWAVSTVAAVITFFLSNAVYAGDLPTYAITDPGVLRVILAVGFYCAGIAVMGLAVGFIFRSTAASVAVLITAILVAPMTSLLPKSIADALAKILPTNAGSSFTSLTAPSDGLSITAGFIVFAFWILGLLAIAATAVSKRDA